MNDVKYFGPEHLRKEHETQVPAPVEHKCILCEEQIKEGDVGTIRPGNHVIHYECELRGVIGSVGHQKKTCSCFGGTEEDPPGMTRREAAIAAVKQWAFRRTI